MSARAFVAIAIAGLAAGCAPAADRADAVGASRVRRLARDVVSVRYDARQGTGDRVLGEMIRAMTSTALSAPESREVVGAARAGNLEVAWLALRTEDLWALASGVTPAEAVMRRAAFGFGPAAGATGAVAGAKIDVGAVRDAIASLGAGEVAVRRQGAEIVVRVQLAGRPSIAQEATLWIEMLGRAAGASPGAGAYTVELAAGRMVVAKLTASGRDARALAEGTTVPADVIDRLQISF